MGDVKKLTDHSAKLDLLAKGARGVLPLKLRIGDRIAFKNFDSEVFAIVASVRQMEERSLIVYQLLGTETVGVLNLKKVQYRKLSSEEVAKRLARIK